MPSFSPVPRSVRSSVSLAAFAILLAAPFAVSPVEADVYKWIDANGRVVYSSVPPSGDVKVERVNTPAAASPDALKQMASQEADLKKRQLDRIQDAERAEKARVDAARREEGCSTARGQTKALLNDSMPLYRVNERGERILMDAVMRKRELDRLDQYMRSECQEKSAATR
jgi:hypothetical protein